MLDKKGLRPTPDRIRETLFNWLTTQVPGSNVLDCFAGAGGLGIEAASRRAKQVTLVDKDAAVSAQLIKQVERLQAENIHIIHSDILTFLSTLTECYNLVFIDPPYDYADLRSTVLEVMIRQKLLCNGAMIYVEWPVEQNMPLNHADLTWIKQKKAGRVNYAIAQWELTG